MSAIFYADADQQRVAEESFQRQLQKCRIHTLLLPSENFYDAEDYHQKYRLRAHKYLIDSLGLQDREKILRSQLAARLNGWLNGYGSVEQFLQEKDKLGLERKEIETYLLPAIKNAVRHC
jgi:peptide-methionine (S)-S-oxide reductase